MRELLDGSAADQVVDELGFAARQHIVCTESVDGGAGRRRAVEEGVEVAEPRWLGEELRVEELRTLGDSLLSRAREYQKLLTSVTALLDLPGFDGSDELMDSLDVIADETQRVVALLPQALAAS